MRDRLFIRIEAGFPETLSWLRVSDDAERHWTLARGSLSDAGREAIGCQVIVLVPGAEVLLAQARVPSRQRQHIINAVPYALEDQLASDIDDLHFALGPRDDEGMVAVAVVARQTMTAWLDRLREAGLEPDVMTPDVLALPLLDKAWTMLHDGAEVLIRQGAYAGAVIDTAVAPAWSDLALAERQDGDRPQQIQLLDCQHGNDDRLVLDMAGHSDVSMEVVAQQEAPLQLLAQNFSMAHCINLIQGDYSRREQVGRLLRPWRLAASLVVVLVLLAMATSVTDYIVLKQADERLTVEIEQIYRHTFPQARKVVDARQQMQHKLNKLRAGGGDDGQGFLSILALIGKPLQGIGSVELRHVTYQDGRLNLSLRIKNLQLLERLKQDLINSKGLKVDIQSASSRDNYVDARLQLWQQGS